MSNKKSRNSSIKVEIVRKKPSFLLHNKDKSESKGGTSLQENSDLQIDSSADIGELTRDEFERRKVALKQSLLTNESEDGNEDGESSKLQENLSDNDETQGLEDSLLQSDNNSLVTEVVSAEEISDNKKPIKNQIKVKKDFEIESKKVYGFGKKEEIIDKTKDSKQVLVGTNNVAVEQNKIRLNPEDIEVKESVVVKIADTEEEKQTKKTIKYYEQKHMDKFRLNRGFIGADDIVEDDEAESGYTRRRRKRQKNRVVVVDNDDTRQHIVREVILPESIQISDLANRMAVKAADVIKSLMKMGLMLTINSSVDADTAELVVMEFGHTPKRVTEADVEKELFSDIQELGTVMKSRPPVVTVMGHVDHGKTSLLDALRMSRVAEGEAGGITQHIGAYRVKSSGGGYITFLDTPGHEAFTEMRSRGAKVTDIVILVVAADDGVKPQTVEALNHAKAAGVPIIVAINKIDKPGANPQKVKTELLEHSLVLEEYGGDVMSVEISAKQRTNIDKLVDVVLLQSEVLELKANYDRAAMGTVIEAKIDTGRGVVTSLLVQKGTLKRGQILVAGRSYGKIKLMNDDKGVSIEEAYPAMPVEVLGLDNAPNAGDRFDVVETEKQARDIVEYRKKFRKDNISASRNKVKLEDLFAEASDSNEKKELTLVIKADVHGSAEAIKSSVEKLATDEVSIMVLHSDVGAINESDITLAKASNAIILGFNVRMSNAVKTMDTRNMVDIRYYSIIYDLINDIKLAMSGMLKPILKEKQTGEVEIREVFNLSKHGKIAGCLVKDGLIKRTSKVRLIRDSVVVYDGTLKALKRFKEDTKEVKSGFECGMSFENYDDIRVGDMIEAYDITEERREIQ